MSTPKSLASLAPGLAKEASGAKVSVSVLLLVGIAYGAYYVGSQRPAADALANEKRAEKVAAIEVTLSRVTTILERMEKTQSEQGRDISAVEQRTHNMNAEVQVISGKVEALTKRR